MREILFRGKSLNDGKWIEGDLVKCSHKHSYIITYFDNGIYDEKESLNKCKVVLHKVKNETVGQYTGLQDKNGKKIFEGDIAYIEDENMYVAYDDGNYGLKYFDDESGYIDLFISWDMTEIIGNIHDKQERGEGE